MGGACACFKMPNQDVLKTHELENVLSSETFPDYDMSLRNNLIEISLKDIQRVSKKAITWKYIKALKSPGLFFVAHPFFHDLISSIESSLVKSVEAEYGEFRITPVWGEFTIPLPCVQIEDTVYEGEWDFFQKLPHGSGISYNLKTTEKYSGNFKLNKRHGLGRLIFHNGDLYEGEFFDGEIHGSGTLLHAQGKVYIGEFVKGHKEGYGKEQDRHESCYEGEFLRGKRHGQGKLIWGDGRCYVGDFADDKMHGVGEGWWPDEKKYYGEWVKDKIHGEGQCFFEDGREYVGQYFRGLEDGNGKMIFPNGDSYDGTWKNGKQHGFGVFSNSEGEKKGEWAEGEFIQWVNE